MCRNETANHGKLVRAEAVIPGQCERLKPELACLALVLNVNVRRLIAIEAGKKQPIWPRDVLDSRHSGG